MMNMVNIFEANEGEHLIYAAKLHTTVSNILFPLIDKN